MKLKPSLAEDAILDKVILPCVCQPKLDGVRAMNLDGKLTGRSLDPFAGFGITEYFSQPEFIGLDGEMILGDNPCAERLCSLTTGAMGKFKGVTVMPDLTWWVFDYLTPDTVNLPYHVRYTLLANRVITLGHPRIRLVPSVSVGRMDVLQFHITDFAQQGYEGTIIRNPSAVYKEGRATQKGQELWRVKPWADAEMLVTGITEGEANGNEAKTNSLGRTERSSAKAGMVPNGQVGSIQGTLLKDFVLDGKVILAKGLAITVSSGKMTEKEAAYYFSHPDEIVGHIVKFNFMTYGIKDLPRFPGYVSHRLQTDMS